jgi:uncharacterized membrane protein
VVVSLLIGNIGILAIVASALVLILQAFFKFDLRTFVVAFFILFLLSLIGEMVLFLIPVVAPDALNPTYFAFAFVLIHCSNSLGTRKAVVFFAIAWSSGLVSELLGVTYGLVFGPYYYIQAKFFWGLVPLATPFSWAVIIYVAYALTNQISFNLIDDRRSFKLTRTGSAAVLIVLSAISGLVAMNLDMILDPVAVSLQTPGWVWIGGGPYFNIPLSNFIGWFFVTFFAILAFRVYERLKSESSEGVTVDVFIPVLYLVYFAIQASLAVQIGHPELVLIGVATMFPFMLFAILAFYIQHTRRNR